MPSLEQTLVRQDYGYLQIVAELWGQDLPAESLKSAAAHLAKLMQQEALLLEIIESLPPACGQALAALCQQEGKIPWSAFTRRYGLLREMGPARRDRELPHLTPISITEMLFYHGLLGHHFLATPDGPQDFAYLPDELCALLRPHLPAAPSSPSVFGRPARGQESAHPVLGSDIILEDAVTLLAALRLETEPAFPLTVSRPFLEALFRQSGILQAKTLQPSAIKAFLEMPRAQAWLHLVQIWLEGPINDLCMTPGLHCEGTWRNDPLATRQKILPWLQALPRGKWWSLNSLIEDIYQHQPDFQRSGGSYDAWIIRAEDTKYLSGFEHWHQVEGALLRYLIRGPLHWLGLVDLAAASADEPAAAFRLSPYAADLLKGQRPALPAPESESLHLSSRGEIHIPRGSSRALRYQISRFCTWRKSDAYGFTYQIEPASLVRAEKQGLTAQHLMILLEKHAKAALPPTLRQSLLRWAQQGSEARLEKRVLLRVRSAQTLAALKNTSAARFLGEQLNPTTIIVHPGGSDKIRAALAEMGLLLEDEENHQNQAD